MLAALTGASITFFLARAFGRDLSERLLRGRLRELDARIADGGFWLVVFLRLVPLFPFNGINYGSGLTRLSFRDYFAGSAIGMIPGTGAYTLLGYAAASRSGPIVALALGGLGLLALIPLAVQVVKARSAWWG